MTPRVTPCDIEKGMLHRKVASASIPYPSCHEKQEREMKIRMSLTNCTMTCRVAMEPRTQRTLAHGTISQQPDSIPALQRKSIVQMLSLPHSHTAGH